MPTTILDGETYEQARHRRFTEEAKVIEKMQQDEIIRMAKESGAVERYFGNQLHGIAFHKKEWLERFADLVAAHEREACVKLVLDNAWALTFQTFGQYRTALAAAIRARK